MGDVDHEASSDTKRSLLHMEEKIDISERKKVNNIQEKKRGGRFVSTPLFCGTQNIVVTRKKSACPADQ